MPTVYHPFKIALTGGQKESLRKAAKERAAVTLRVKPEQIGNGDILLLTTTQTNRLKKAASSGHGADVAISKIQMVKTMQRRGNLLSAALSLGRALAPSVGKALGMADLSFGLEKVLKKIFGNGVGPQEVQLYKFTQMLSPDQKKALEKYLVGQGMVRGGGAAQYGGFLGMLASIGVPLAIILVQKMFGGATRLGPTPSRSRRSAPRLPAPPGCMGKVGRQGAFDDGAGEKSEVQ